MCPPEVERAGQEGSPGPDRREQEGADIEQRITWRQPQRPGVDDHSEDERRDRHDPTPLEGPVGLGVVAGHGHDKRSAEEPAQFGECEIHDDETMPQMTPDQHVRVLVTGATGYIGSRLVPALLAAGHEVRVLTRSADRLTARDWHDSVEIVEGDATSRADLDRALDGIEVAYYLLHSMDGSPDFEERDRELARLFGLSAQAKDVQRLVYLSGLHPDEETLSTHLASRVEVGDLLMASGVPTVVLQAAIIIGSGSASFEMLRHLTHRLPVMLTPKWVDNRIQPIAIRDVLHYLVGAATIEGEINRTFDIGGPDVLTYREMIQGFAEVAGLRPRPIRTVPVLTPGLASHWVGLVTPVPSGIAKPLVGSLIHEVVRREHDIDELIEQPSGGALHFASSVRAALVDESGDQLPEPGTVDPARLTAADPDWAG